MTAARLLGLFLAAAQGAAAQRLALVRILHPSGAGGTTICDVAKATPWVRLTAWQAEHRCNLDGHGPRLDDDAMAAAASKCRVPGANWVQYEHAFDAEPCDGTVKEVLLFREPWDRLRSLLLKTRRPRIQVALDCLRERKNCDAYLLQKRRAYWLLDNSLVRLLNGRQTYAVPFGGLGPAHLERAKRVASRMDGVVETKDLDNATRILEGVLGRAVAKAGHSNEHVRTAANTTALELAFKEKNRLDYLLYEHVRGLAAASRPGGGGPR